jgi:hypothetical protein
MATTFVKITSVTVGAGGTSSISFSSIPSTYTDLCLKVSLRNGTVNNDDSLSISYNGSSTSFTSKWLQGSGAGAYSGSRSDYFQLFIVDQNNYTANTFSNAEIYIPNYAGSNNKSFSTDAVTETNATSANMGLTAALWSNTAAINAITLTIGAGLFAQYSTATLYGIKNS